MLNTPPPDGSKLPDAQESGRSYLLTPSANSAHSPVAIWYSSDAAETHHLPVNFFWPAHILTRILDNVHLISTSATLKLLLLADWCSFTTECDGLFEGIVLTSWRDPFRKRRNTIAANKGEHAMSSSLFLALMVAVL